MKSKHNQQFNTLTSTEANDLVKKNFDANYWAFIVKNMNYPEITINPTNEKISFPDFIPFKDLANEVIVDLEKTKNEIKICRVCEMYFNINNEDGIFGDPSKLQNFICSECSKKMSAKDFYDNFMIM